MRPSDMSQNCIALVVDDNPEALGMVSTALERNGITVLVATDGQSAIDLTHRVRPDVILMDAVMPGLSGFETCRTLKSGPDAVMAPIIFMTGLSDQEHILEGLSSGGVDYITKPVIVEELIARLSTHIANSRLLQSARAALDSSGRSVLAFDLDGTLLWGSSQAKETFRSFDLSHHAPAWRAWIASCGRQPVSAVLPYEVGPLTFQFMGVTPVPEVLVKLILRSSDRKEDVLARQFDLTPREAEVLFWLTLGKTNRDISSILGLSARTVNKHLEQVFQKMGIDNRTSAAVMADRVLNAQ
ncbi:DNA-binding response regulator [Roseobacter cerasinus]|uniref:DNA-binding response regulator n=1 Tax=Roseobacter cerasinus TaxID=2602289 RepID=A0A640VUV2_9RHOB|nr:DNA-binding response regulator [Roseobacter cerasinus]GFE50675.1 DNA-binding response regulator [Roseobacter cerasinus]